MTTHVTLAAGAWLLPLAAAGAVAVWDFETAETDWRPRMDSACARWLNLVWHDPTVTPTPPTDRATLRRFPDMDIVSARSDWSGDEALVVFKCGPCIGRKAVQEFSYDPGGGHVHPDANHFVVFGQGEWLIRDDGYHAKWTGQHNTLLIDGNGQLGEGAQWFQGSIPLRLRSRPRIVRAGSAPGLDHIAGDATEAYPAASGLKRFVRHLLFVKPNVLIVVDDVEPAEPRRLELRFHPEATKATRDGAALVIPGKRSVLRIEPLTAEDVEVTAEEVRGEGRKGKELSLFTIRLCAERAQWRNAVAFSWSAAGTAPARVTCRPAQDAWTFAAGTRRVALDWRTGEASETR